MATIRAKVARLFRGKKKSKEESLRSGRTEATRKATGDTDVTHMMSKEVRSKSGDKPAEKKPERKAPTASTQTVSAIAAEIKRREDEKKKKK